MIRYAKIIDYKTKEVEVGSGEDEEYYRKNKMTPMDVEQGYNDLWYKKGYAPKKPEPTEDELKEENKAKRNILLIDTDYTQLPDSPLSEEEKEQYKEYRSYLRDYTKEENWWKESPKSYDEWQKTIDF